MGEEFLKWIITSSIMGSVLTVLILLVKKVFNRNLEAKWHYYIWLLLIVRLLMPFSIESSLSIFNFNMPQEINLVKERVQTSMPINKDAQPESGDLKSDVTPGDDLVNPDTVPSPSPKEDIKAPAVPNPLVDEGKRGMPSLGIFGLWIIGTVILSLFTVICNVRFIRLAKKGSQKEGHRFSSILEQSKIKMGINKNITVLYTEAVEAPTLFGIFKPKLLINHNIINNLSDDELRYIVIHELTHLKRKDILVKWVMTAAKIIHWFNPLIWYASYNMDQDCETSCDANVLRQLNPEEHKKYGYTIIKLIEVFSTPKFVPGVTGILGNKINIKRRIKMINGFKKTSLMWSLVTLLLVACIAVIGLTNPLNADSIDQEVNLPQEGNLPLVKEGTIVDLEFTPVSTEVLKEGRPDESFEKVKTIELGDMEANLHIYLEPKDDDTKTIHGFIENKTGWYEVGIMSEYGLDSLSIRLLSTTGKVKDQVEIIGDMGASYREMRVMKYDSNKDQWINLLTMGSPERLDLDNDNQEELLAVSVGSIPSSVDIYRWRGGQFERASVTEATGNLYAYLQHTGISKEYSDKYDGAILIESGKPNQPYLYQYKNEKLYRLSNVESDDAAKDVIEKSFEYRNAKDEKMILNTLTKDRRGDNLKWDFENLESIKIIDIKEEKRESERYSYLTNGRGSVNGTTEANLRIYTVRYELKLKNDKIGSQESGIYEWWYYVIRQDEKSPWLIDDFGQKLY